MKNKKEKFLNLKNCPEIKNRKPFTINGKKIKGYYESDHDFMVDNQEACLWFLKKAKTLTRIKK